MGESRERKAENAAAKKAAILKAKEDASWEDNDKQLARKADRANAASEKRETELARKKANQELYEAQMAQMEKSKKKSKKNSKVVEQPTELEENINKLDLGPAASNIDDAIDLLSSTNDKEDRHPEKRMKASYKKFEEERYETVKQENPSLKRTQIKE